MERRRACNATLKEHKVVTFRGDVLTFSEMTDQHLINCYWYTLIVTGEDLRNTNYEEYLVHKRDINPRNRSYLPNPAFTNEMRRLKKKGHLLEKGGFIHIRLTPGVDEILVGYIQNPYYE